MNKNIPLVSVIVPVYNAESDLERCLNSLIALEYINNYEVILVDDGSKDNSGKICDKYKKNYEFFKVIHQENAGVSIARNVGIEHAVGKYIMFVDADDYLTPFAIQNIIVEAQNTCDLVIFNSYFDAGERYLHSYPEVKKKEKRQCLPVDTVYSIFLKLQNNEPFSKLFSVKIIKEAQVKFPVDIRLGEDLIFTLEFLKKVQMVTYVPEIIYTHVNNIDGLSKKNRSLAMLHDFDAMYSSLLAFVKDMNLNRVHYTEVVESILQSVTNYCGKLFCNGYTSEKITAEISGFYWYELILTFKVSHLKSILRRILLKYKCYFIICRIFNK